MKTRVERNLCNVFKFIIYTMERDFDRSILEHFWLLSENKQDVRIRSISGVISILQKEKVCLQKCQN